MKLYSYLYPGTGISTDSMHLFDIPEHLQPKEKGGYVLTVENNEVVAVDPFSFTPLRPDEDDMKIETDAEYANRAAEREAQAVEHRGAFVKRNGVTEHMPDVLVVSPPWMGQLIEAAALITASDNGDGQVRGAASTFLQKMWAAEAPVKVEGSGD